MTLRKVSMCEMIEEQCNSLDKSCHAAALLTDLGKTFDWVYHELLIGDFYVSGLNNSSQIFLYSYLVKFPKQRGKVNSSCNLRTDVLYDVPKVLL